MSTFEQTEQLQAPPLRTTRPGSDGEHLVQQRMRTAERADRFYAEQVLDRLNPRMREFVARQEMFFLATADRHGDCDNTFRAGPPGFLHVLDDGTLAYPEYRGNGVHASLGNIEENPHVGLLMVDFFRDRVGLHVNGRARVVADDEMRRAHSGLAVDPVPGRRALVWVEIAVEEAYIHCAKHIPHLEKVLGTAARAAPGERTTSGARAATTSGRPPKRRSAACSCRRPVRARRVGGRRRSGWWRGPRTVPRATARSAAGSAAAPPRGRGPSGGAESQRLRPGRW